MSTIKILVTPYVVKNKPETERGYDVVGEPKGWVKQQLNQDGKEILTESEGLDVLLEDCNLEDDGKTKIDPDKPIGKEVIINIYNPDAIAITGVAVTPATPSVHVNVNQTFTATITPSDATYKDVEWSSSDEAIATSLGGGIFKGLTVGTVTISAISIDGGIVGTATLTVTIAAASVTVAPTTLALKVGGATGTVVPTVLPANATNKVVTFASSNTAIATVNSSTGVVTAVANGTATITATTADGAFTATCAVTVTTDVASVTLAPTTVTLAAAATQQLTPTVLPATASVKTVTYASSNTAVATVNASGLITAVATGTATITVTTTDGAKTATCVVTVS